MRIEILKVANPRITCLNLYSTKSKAVARENNFIHLKIRPLVFMLWPNGIRSNVGHRIVQARSIDVCVLIELSIHWKWGLQRYPFRPNLIVNQYSGIHLRQLFIRPVRVWILIAVSLLISKVYCHAQFEMI